MQNHLKSDLQHVPSSTGDSTNNEPWLEQGWLEQMTKRCSVIGCHHLADVEVLVCACDPADPNDMDVEPDTSCPYLCFEHMRENENNAFSVVPSDEPGPVFKRAGDANCSNDEGIKVAPIRSPDIGVRYPFTLKDVPPEYPAFVIYYPPGRV
jgi:hypothetical protein